MIPSHASLMRDNEALRKELAETKNLATYDYMNGQAELSAVRKELAEAKAKLDKLQKAYDESHNENRDLLQFIERMEQEIDRA